MLVELLRDRSDGEAEAPAFVVAGGGILGSRSWDSRSDALGRGLLARGVVAGDRVILRFDAGRWIDFAVSYAGVHKAGAVPVLLGPAAPDRVLRRAVTRSGARGVVTSSMPARPDALAGTPAWLSPPAELEGGGAEGEVPTPVPAELAHLSLRSSPLRAFHPVEHRAGDILSSLSGLDAALPAGGPLIHAFDPASAGGTRALWVALGRGRGPVVVLPELDPHALCARTAGYEAAGWSLAPATAGWLLDSGALEDHDLTSVVRVVLLEGEAPPALRSRLAAALPAAASPSSFSVGSTVSGTAHPTEFEQGGEGGEEAGTPVAFSQEGMLWHEVFAPGSQNLPPLVRRYRGTLDVAALERALAEIVRRHEPLRSTFEVRAGRPVQVVRPAGGLELEKVDLAGRAPGAQDDEVAALMAAAGRPFDLVEGPLFAAQLVRLGPDDHLVVLRVHHSVFDDWSVSVFRRELSALYRSFAAGEPSPLDDLAVSFSDFSRAQHRRLGGPERDSELGWWRERLAGAPLSLQLPIDDPDREQGAPQASAEPVSLDLSPALSAQLRALARRERTTLFMTMLAAFEVLVQRHTGQSDLLAASVVANRNRPELEAMIGCFTKKVLVRLDGSGDPTFTELLPRVRAAMVGVLAHQGLPFDAVLQEVLGAEAAVHGLVPHVAVMFQGVTPQSEDVVLPGLTTSGYETSATMARTHFSAGDGDGGPLDDTVPWGAGLYLGTFLILSVIETAERVSLAARGAFHGPSVERLLATFEMLLGDIVEHPARRISQLRVVAEEEAAQLVAAGGGTATPAEGRPARCFEERVAAAPGRVAITEGGRHVTYAELDARADALHGRLRERGVGPGDLVGVYSGCSTAGVVAVLAVWKAGAGYVPLEPEASGKRMTEMMERASLRVVVTDGRPPPVPHGAAVLAVNDTGPPPPPGSPGPPGPGGRSDPDAAALVFYGKGPSPRRRGVVIGHRAVAKLASGLEAALHPPSAGLPSTGGRRVCLAAGPADESFLRQVVALLSGHTLHIVTGEASERCQEMVRLVGRADVDRVECSPAELGSLVAAGLGPALEARAVVAPAPVVVVAASSPVDHETWRVLRSLTGVAAHHLYGPAECSFGAAVVPVSAPHRRLTLGPLLGGTVPVVLDAHGELVGERVTGELHLGGPALAREEPAREDVDGGGGANFVEASPAGIASVRLFRTGQLARRLPGGRVELLGPVADTFRLGGYPVDRARIAAALLRCPGVAGADVFVREAAGGPRLVARVVPVEGQRVPDLARLQVELWAGLPGYAWPAEVEVEDQAVNDEELPEARLLASLWAEAQGVDRINGHENYWQAFSFLDTISRARETGVALGDEEVTRNRTVASLAAAWAARRSPFRLR